MIQPCLSKPCHFFVFPQPNLPALQEKKTGAAVGQKETVDQQLGLAGKKEIEHGGTDS
jgi:hypothetical protein